MKLAILGAMDAEVELLVKHMQVEDKVEAIGTTFYSGTLEGCQVVTAVMSIGKVSAALCAAHVIREFGVDAVINVGIAGTMTKELTMMDVVVSSAVQYHDVEAFYDQFYPHTTCFKADEKLLKLALEACEEVVAPHGRKYMPGLIVTGDQFITGKAKLDAIRERFTPHGVEMEGAAVGQAAFVYGVPFLVVRTISDTAGDDTMDTYFDFKQAAADQSASIMIALAHKLA